MLTHRTYINTLFSYIIVASSILVNATLHACSYPTAVQKYPHVFTRTQKLLKYGFSVQDHLSASIRRREARAHQQTLKLLNSDGRKTYNQIRHQTIVDWEQNTPQTVVHSSEIPPYLRSMTMGELIHNGLNPYHFNIKPFKESDYFVPAQVDGANRIVYLDPLRMKMFSQSMQEFIIAHEVKHITEKHWLPKLDLVIDVSLFEGNKTAYNHLIETCNNLRRCEELTADQLSATRSVRLAHAGMQLFYPFIKIKAPVTGTDQPSLQQRYYQLKNIALWLQVEHFLKTGHWPEL